MDGAARSQLRLVIAGPDPDDEIELWERLFGQDVLMSRSGLKPLLQFFFPTQEKRIDNQQTRADADRSVGDVE